jgi:hypothetical protein
MIYVPFLQGILGFVPLTLIDWIWVIVFSSAGLLVIPELLIKKEKI